MEKAVLDIYTEEVHKAVTAPYQTTFAQLKPLGDFENFVYGFDYAGIPHILRVVHSSHRSQTQIAGEIDWVNYLADNGVAVARAVPSQQGNLIEVVEASDQSQFFVTAFRQAPGKRVTDEDWNDRFFQHWGQVLGQIHHLTQAYQPSLGIPPRYHWYEDNYMVHGYTYLPASKPHIIEKWHSLLQSTKQLPTSPTTYGLVHTDVHAGNFHISNHQITLFDFDDCCYHWFIFDIAIVLYYTFWSPTASKDKIGFTQHFMPLFWRGYRQENDLDVEQIEQMHHFLKLRDLQLYAVLHFKWDLDNLYEGQQAMLDRFQQRIESGEPLVDVDFKKWQ